MKTEGQNITCPHCGETNPYAHDEGATDGPREYHAECWYQAAAEMSDHEIAQAWAISPLGDD